MSILVTGSAGLVGSSLIELLISKGEQVIGYDRSLTKAPLSGCIYEKGDLCDFPRIAYILQKHKVDRIVHSGGLSHPYAGTESPNEMVQTNIVGTLNIFEASRLFGIKRVVYLSSGAVYGNSDKLVMQEEEPLRPTTVYAVSKLTGEMLADVYSNNYNMSMVSLRLASVYGPRCFMPDAVKDLLEKAVRGENIRQEQGADQQLEFLYVKDAARAIWLAVNAENKPHKVYNIGSGVNQTVRDVADIIQKVYPNLDIEIGEGGMNYDFLGAFDCSMAEKDLGFKAEYSLEAGIRDYVEYLKKQ
jgi:nucleoside-diphosphate-sugar epimerase